MNPSRHVLPFAAATMLLLVAARGQCDLSAIPGDPMRELRGNVDALATWDPDGGGPLPLHLVAGGTFDVGSVLNEHVVLWNGTSWTNTNANFGAVTSLIVWNNLLVAAAEDALWTFDGTAWTVLASVEEGSPTAPLPGAVHSMMLWNGDLVIGGRFTRVVAPFAPQLNAYLVARLSATTGWSALGAGPTTTNMSGPRVQALAVFNNTVWVGLGCNTNFSNTSTLQFLNGTTWLGQSPWVDPIDALGTRIGTALTNSWLFATAHSLTTPTFTVAGFNPVLGTTNTINAPPAAGVSKLEQFFVRGTGISTYEVVCTITTNGTDKLWRWTAAGGWFPLPNLTDPAGAIDTTRVNFFSSRYVAGFRCASGAPRGLRSLDSSISQWVPYAGGGFDLGPNCVCQDGSELVVGGRFVTFGSTAVNRIARGNAGAWSPLGSGFAISQFGVMAVCKLANGDIVAGGDFTALGDGTPMSRIARWNGVAWSDLGGGMDGAVETLLPLPNGELIAGGWFTSAGGQPANRIARWTGTAWVPLGSGCSSAVRALLLASNGDIVAGGGFVSAGGLTANGIARWDGAQWTALGSGFDADVYALTESNEGIVAGGAFQHAGSFSIRHLARWNGSSWLPFGPVPIQPDQPVRALTTLPGGETAIGGVSFTAGAAASTCAAVWRGNAWETLGVQGSEVRGMVMLPDGRLAIVGRFDRVENTISANVATIVSDCPAIATSVAPGCAGDTLTAVTLPWVNGPVRTQAIGLPATALVLVLSSVTPVVPAVPLSMLLAEGVPGCDLHVAPDILQLAIAAGGSAQSEFALPNTPPIVGVHFYQQMIPIEIDAGTGAWIAITATNALQFVGGSF